MSVGAFEAGEHILSLRDLLEVLWRRLWVILLVLTVFAGAAVGFSLAQTPMYEASIRVLIGQAPASVPQGNLGGDIEGLRRLTQTMAEAVGTRPIANEVIDRLDLQTTPGDLLSQLSARQVADTQFISIRYRDPSPERAQRVVNAVGEVFSERVSEVSPSANAITATVWEQAETPGGLVSPDLVLNVAMALVVGLVLGVALAFLLEYLDDSWRSPEEAEQITGVPTFGVIPEFKSSTGKKKG